MRNNEYKQEFIIDREYVVEMISKSMNVDTEVVGRLYDLNVSKVNNLIILFLI